MSKNKNFFNKIHYSKYSEYYTFSFLFALCITLLFYFFSFIKIKNELILNFYTDYITTIFGSSASIFGISLAALSIFISVIYKPAIPKMIEENLLEIFLYPFLVTVILWGSILISSLFIFLRDISPLIETIVTYKSIFFGFLIFQILSAIFYTISLSNHVLKTTLTSFKGE